MYAFGVGYECLHVEMFPAEEKKEISFRALKDFRTEKHMGNDAE